MTALFRTLRDRLIDRLNRTGCRQIAWCSLCYRQAVQYLYVNTGGDGDAAIGEPDWVLCSQHPLAREATINLQYDHVLTRYQIMRTVLLYRKCISGGQVHIASAWNGEFPCLCRLSNHHDYDDTIVLPTPEV